ncbi:MAG TPA: GNAT family protein [Candidatus Elarobacter sp.]|nr:GNAT family protein [Candidatus Elarobacter sp.]
MSDGERVELRRVLRTDAGALIAANLDNVDYHAPWETAFTDQAAFDAWFDRGVLGAKVLLVAHERATGDVVGVINLNDIVLGRFKSAHFGYWGYRRTGGRGLMTEALRLAVRYAFDEVGLHRVEANIQPNNVRSLALARRAGFTKEGYSQRYLFIDGAWRDHERWTRLAD